MPAQTIHAAARVAETAATAGSPEAQRRRARRERQHGQVLVIFAGAMIALVALMAVVVDVAWYWTNNLRMQRAADAAALAGVVWLPGEVDTAYSTARDEAAKNGYANGVDGVVVTPVQDSTNPRRLRVSITGPVGTFFARVMGISSWPAARSAKADYVLPVPMGSPENYYGVFGMTRGLTSTETTTTTTPHTDRDWSCGSGSSWSSASCTGRVPSVAQTGTWTSSSTSSGNNLSNSLATNNNVYARTGTTGAQQQWSGFAAQSGMPTPGSGETLDIVGLQVRVSDAFINSSCSGGSASIGVALSWDGGGNWSTVVNAPTSGSLGTNTSNGDYTIGSSTSMSAWGGHTWARGEFSDSNFQIRLTANETCTGTKTFSVDRVEVRVTWDYSYTTTDTSDVTTNLTDVLLKGPGTACTTGKAACYEADGANLNPRGFWGTLNTQGAENINGDAYQPYYDTRTSGISPACPQDRACFDPVSYYNYAVELPAGASNGAVYVYDPVFCDVSPGKGTGDRWFSGSTAVSTFYELYDTQNTLSDPGDDALVADSGTRFRRIDADDSTMSGSSGTDECKYRADTQYGDGRDYHNRWYLLASGLAGGTVYRLHTTSTDPTSPTDQRSTDGENSFAIYASASGGSPRVYGLGAMQAFTPLSASGTEVVSEFYLAQIDAVHAGKTMEIRLWDPGDTDPLNAKLQILSPTSGGWTPATFTYTASQGTTDSGHATCNALTSPPGGTNIVETNAGSTNGTFNGCWLKLRVVIPSGYTAEQDGWWLIRYRMNGSGTSNDVTTWTVNILGNPVHLVLP